VSYGQFQFRRDTSTNWTNNNPVLLSGELGIETNTHQFKIGDGVTVWTSLAYGGMQGVTGTTGVGNPAVQVVANTNQALTGLPTIDNVALTNSARLLLVAQSTNTQNGIWTTAASGSGAWVRPTDFSSTSNQVGSAVDVEAGSTYTATRWVMTGISMVTVDTSPQSWIELLEGTMPAYTLQGNNTASASPPLNLTTTQILAMLNTSSIGQTVAASRGYNLN
jgi:hypothetical protein